jgi:hypothetical protein
VKALTFAIEHGYQSSPAGIEVPIILERDEARSVRLLAKVDTGATDCIFQRDYADQLGLPVESGERKTFSTITGQFEAYAHRLTVRCFHWQFEATVYFADSYDYHRNVVGRSGWLQQFRLAIIDHDALLLLSHYDD